MSPQQTIAHYRITAKLGEGGMGAVYRATDTKLNRDVAVKILPDAFASDADRMARFQREAQVLASLNHPNIAHIYGVEERALILELVEGATLEERIAQGPIPVEEALPVARQIAEALEYAHERGIVHRDLKPANIKLTPEGRAKVLDFGLAKAMSQEATAAADAANSPTLTMRATMAGMILGTASYMSPEQAKGKPVDRRADIWAFGMVLFEMLSGSQMYAGETVSETLAAVIMKEPDLSVLPAATPSAIRTLLRRCLEKDPLRRLRDIGEARVLLERVPADEQSAAPPAPAVRSSRLPWIVAALCALAAAILAVIHFRESPPPASPLRLTMLAPDKEDFGRWLALSPNGRLIAFTARRTPTGIWIRPLDSTQARVLAGTEGANTFFWSPDSRFLVFATGGKLKKIDVSGGPPESLCDFNAVLLGGSWNADGVILFGGTSGPIMRVPASGGTAAPVTAQDTAHSEGSHLYPTFLPDGRHFVYLRGGGLSDSAGIYAGSLDTQPAQQSTQRIVAMAGLSFAYAPARSGVAGPARLLFMREGALVAIPFDDKSLRAAGDAVPVAEDISTSLSLAAFTVSSNGLLAYHTGSAATDSTQFHWFDRQGKELGLAGTSNGNVIALSPDETRLAHPQSAVGQGTSLWVLDLARGVNTRFSFTPDGGTAPVWSPDGKWIAFSAAIRGSTSIYIKDASSGAPERLLLQSPGPKAVCDWSSDGKFLIYSDSQNGKWQLWAIPDPLAAGERKPIPVAASAYSMNSAQLSSDGRWLAYSSNESGKYEIYVRPFPPGDGRMGQWLVSSAGGITPRWRTDGKELFYIAADSKLMAADVIAGRAGDAAFHSGAPHPLFGTTVGSMTTAFRYAVSRDGKRFLVGVPAGPGAPAAPLNVVVNWEAGLRR